MVRNTRRETKAPSRKSTALQTAAAYERVVERFVRWAQDHPDIRAAAVVGSRARTDHPADQWADMDLGVFCDSPERYADDPAWVEALGHPWITFVEPAAVGQARERRVLFEGGLDVDVALFPTALLEQMAAEGMPADFADTVRRGVRILLDQGGWFAAAAAQVVPVRSPALPSAAEVRNVVGDFWYHAVWTAKHLRRGELWWAKSGCDQHMKELLRRMLEWHARAVRGPEADTWMRGRFLEEWADPRAVRDLRGAFARYESRDVWHALFATMDLFRWLSRETMARLGYAYPDEGDRRATEYVKRLAPAGAVGHRTPRRAHL